jgi:predicted amidophosphoribosyltransferase
MRLVIGKDTKKSLDKRPLMARARGQQTRSCRCGQQLDVCARAHCPRCGRTLDRD